MRVSVLLNPTQCSKPRPPRPLKLVRRGWRPGEGHRSHSPASTAGAVRRALDSGATVVAAGGGDGTVSTIAAALPDSHVPLGVLPLGYAQPFREGSRPSRRPRAGSRRHRRRPPDAGRRGRGQRPGLHQQLVDRHLSRHRCRTRGTASPRLPEMDCLRDRDGPGAAQVSRSRRTRPQRSGAPRHSGRRSCSSATTNTRWRGSASAGGPAWIRAACTAYVAPRLRADLPKLGASALLGRATRNPSLRAFATDELEVSTPGRRMLRVALDGEVTHMVTPLRYRVRHAALEVMVPGSATSAAT